jgi:hypothetical protein
LLGGSPELFFVEFPLTGDGAPALALPGRSPAPRAASTAELSMLIGRGGYDDTSQFLQFLAAPTTRRSYDVYVDSVQRFANETRRTVFIVGGMARTSRIFGMAGRLWRRTLAGRPSRGGRLVRCR